MAVKEVLNAIGSFDLNLKPDTPKDLITTVTYFGHVAIIPGRIDPRQYGDELLDEARYVGVLREKSIGGQSISIGGVGMAWHLGDEGTRGSVIEVPATFAAETFPNTIAALLPDAVQVGTLYSVPGITYTGTHQWQTAREAVQYVCEYFSRPNALVSWRVNNNATLDAGPEEDLFVTDPQCIIIRKGAGEDLSMRALPGSFESKLDAEDYTTRVVLLAEGEGAAIYLGEAEKEPSQIPYKDLHGNPLVVTRVVSESDTTAGNADVRAELALNSYEGTRAELTLSTKDYDVKGSFSVGDRVYVYDPDAELFDTDYEVTFRGQRFNPIVLKVTETDWPVTEAYTVAYRDADGAWYDLTDYVEFEAEGDSRITVGDFSRQLTSTHTQPIGSRPSVDTSTPDVPTWTTPFQVVNYQDDLGFTRSRVLLAWSAPNNTDGSTVLDGDHYEIQVRVDTDAIYPQSWSSVSSTSWADANSWSQPFTPALSAWQTYYVAWGESSYFINDLATGVGYDVRIRAVDKVGNLGDWQETTFVTNQDNIPPSTPAAPSVAGSRIALQISHELGVATGGTFNLEQDVHHLEIHVDYEPHFTPSDSTLKGTVIANQGMIVAQIPAVATVQVEETSTRYVRVIAVDRAGNKSLPSEAASADALLIDDAHISDLTVTKVTAGTVSANWLLGASIRTASSGARVELNQDGLQAFNTAGAQTVDIDSATGNVTIAGTLRSTTTNFGAIEIGQTGDVGQIKMFSPDGTTYARIFSVDDSTVAGASADIKIVSSFDDDGIASFTGHLEDRWVAGRLTLTDGIYRYKGGGYYADNTAAVVTYSPNAEAGELTKTSLILSESQVVLGINRGETDEQVWLLDEDSTRHFGRWPNFVSNGSRSGLFTGTLVASTTDSLSILYGATMDTSMVPIVTCQATNFGTATPTVWGVQTTNNSGFTVSWNNSQNMRINFWCFRI